MEESKKKRNIIIIICVLATICLMGAAAVVAAVFLKRNPLAKGLANLADEVITLEAEMGENFWSDVMNQIGSENIQAEYSVNIGGIPELQNITVGLDGKIRRDMERQLFDAEIAFSVTNAEIAQVSLLGTADTLYLQVPSVWEGSVVFDTENIDEQWNNSAVKEELQILAGQGLDIDRGIDAELFRKFSLDSFSAADFLKENGEALKALYENMEVVEVEKAQKEGKISGEHAKILENYMLEDAEGEQVETICYLVTLPERELKEIFTDLVGDIRLCVYLDSEKRIVRICTLPGETLVTEVGQGTIAVNLTGREATIDRLEVESLGTVYGDGISDDLSGGAEVEGTIIIEKEKDVKGLYAVECEGSLTEQRGVWELSLAGSVHGEQIDAGEKLSLEVDSLVLKLQSEVICRGSGDAEFVPLAEDVQMPSGEEYKIGEMNKLEAMLFLAKCTKNVYDNYSGYLKLLQ